MGSQPLGDLNRDVRQPSSTGKRSLTAPSLSFDSTSDEVTAWLQSFLPAKDFATVTVGNTSGQELLEKSSCSEEIASLLSTSKKLSIRISGELRSIEPENTKRRRSSIDQDHEAAAPIVKPEPGASQPVANEAAGEDVNMQEPTAIVKPDLDDACSDSDPDAEELMQNEADEGAPAAIVKPDPAADIIDAPMPDIDDAPVADAAADDELEPEAATAEGDDEKAEDGGPLEIDEEGAALDAAEAAGGGAGAVELVNMATVELPEDENAQRRYIDRALAGIGALLCDSKVVCKSVYKTLKPPLEVGIDPQQRPVAYARKEMDADVLSMALWKFFDSELNKRIPQCDDAAERRRLRETVLETLKAALHRALSKALVQTHPSLLAVMHKLMPVETQVLQTEVQIEGTEDIRVDEQVVNVLPPDLLERLWGVWQAAPYLCTLELPVILRKKEKTLKVAHGLRSIGGHFQREFFVAGNDAKKKCTLKGSGQALMETEETLEVLKRVVSERQGPGGERNAKLSLVVALKEDPAAADQADEDVASLMRLCEVQVYLDVGMVGTSLDQGFSGFVQYEQGGELVLENLLRRSKDYQGEAVMQRLTAFRAKVQAELNSLEDIGDDMHKTVTGLQFKRLLAQLNESVQEYPQELVDRLAGVLVSTMTPKPHQRASIAFIEQEESAEGGVQRNFWWPLALPGAPGIHAMYSPLFDALWVASAPQHMYKPAEVHEYSARCHGKHRVFEEPPRGGMLALDMGMGKTLCIVAPHALEQHTLPDKPAMHTEHSKAALDKVTEVVYVGKRYPEEPERENLKETNMYTGFMQVDDGFGTIVPDGSVTFEGRGNLVCVPPHLAMQWEREIKAMCVRPQRIIVIHDKKSRTHVLSSVEGMRMVAAADWVIMTPSSFVACRPLCNAITFRRVIADEAHQLTAAVPEYKGLPALQRECAVMTELGKVPVSVARWCLSGTPLKNFRNVQAMDRVFKFVHSGFRTTCLTNLQFVLAFGSLAIRFTKNGKFQGETCVELPPLSEHVVMVELSDADRSFYGLALSALVNKSNVPRDVIANLQAGKHAEAKSDDDEEDEDYMTDAQKRESLKEKYRWKLLSVVVDPIRKVLSGAMMLYPRLDADGSLDLSIEGMTVDTPEIMKKPRKQRGGEAMTQKQWEATAEYEAAAANFSKVVITGKIDRIIEDVRNLLTEAEEEGHERPPKVVMFSTYDKSFARVIETLDREQIQYVSLMKGGDLKKKEEMMQRFNTQPDVPVFLLNKTCGAVGLNLTVATHVFILETNWDSTWEAQAIGRAYRLGQTGPVKVMRYLCQDTVESRLRDLMVAEVDDGKSSTLSQALQGKSQFQSDEKVLNETVTRLFSEADIAKLIGDLGEFEESDDDGESDEGEEEQD